MTMPIEIKHRITKDTILVVPGGTLVGADLCGADLRYADLLYTDLGHANLRRARLDYADLRYADLRHARLRFARLGGANLSGADLGDAELVGANLRGVVGYIIGPQRSDGHRIDLRWADGAWRVVAGCRTGLGLTTQQAREHAAGYDDAAKRDETYDILDYLDARAKRTRTEPERTV